MFGNALANFTNYHEINKCNGKEILSDGMKRRKREYNITILYFFTNSIE